MIPNEIIRNGHMQEMRSLCNKHAACRHHYACSLQAFSFRPFCEVYAPQEKYRGGRAISTTFERKTISTLSASSIDWKRFRLSDSQTFSSKKT
jgi:hypothetical protein